MSDDRPIRSRLFRFVARPFRDVIHALERCLPGPENVGAARGKGYRQLAVVGLGLAAGWWVYVPVHELLHALGCVATGGTVSRLEISTLYGGALLARLLPFVAAASDYAGRLSGFDTGGSDAIYLATVGAPYVLTVFPGVWALRRGARAGSALAFGLSLPVALAPFVALPGDAYEIGSILTTRLPPWSALAETLRSDDVVRLAAELARQDGAPWGGVAVGMTLGILWAFLTYAAGSLAAAALGYHR